MSDTRWKLSDDPAAAPTPHSDSLDPKLEICEKCGKTYDLHLNNVGMVWPCWTPSGRYAESPKPRKSDAHSDSLDRKTDNFNTWEIPAEINGAINGFRWAVKYVEDSAQRAVYRIELERAIFDALAALRSENARMAEVAPFADFGVKCFDEFRGNDAWSGGDLDGGWLQDEAVKSGILAPYTVTQACDPEFCACAEVGEFPTECYRLPENLHAAIMEIRRARASRTQSPDANPEKKQ